MPMKPHSWYLYLACSAWVAPAAEADCWQMRMSLPCRTPWYWVAAAAEADCWRMGMSLPCRSPVLTAPTLVQD